MKLSITKRVKEYYEEFTACYFEGGKERKKTGVHGKKLLSSLARARREIIELIKLNITVGSCLLTLTYRQNIQNYDVANTDFKNFVKKIKYNYKIDLRYVRVIELQKRGAIHFHVVIFNSDFCLIPYNEIYNIWGHGAVHVRRIEALDDVTADKIGNYLGKYLTKSKEIAPNKKIYTTSRNIKRLEKQRIVIEDVEQSAYFLERLASVSNAILYLEGKNKIIKFIKARKL